ncbi:MAG TPA: histidine kinase [Prolixibacteraceae bacterium]|nr:histidine kinase [Prolixibacteraceae bacterium]
MESELIKTEFAPAQRADYSTLINQQNEILKDLLLVNMSNSVSQMLLVLNQQRQIVYANKVFTDFLELPEFSPVIGKRPGEAFNCIHSSLTKGGCGTTEFCRKCGAVNAILESQSGVPSEKECRILTVENDALDFRVTASPFDTPNEKLTIFTINDISNEKRKQTLERVFYHDVLNSAGGISGLSNVINELKEPDAIEKIARLINKASENLINEILTQRQISEAETGDLQPVISEINSIEILKDLADLYSRHESIAGKFIAISRASVMTKLKTDAVLLRRVIGNMIKNALEASLPDGTVTISCSKSGENIRFSVHNTTFIPRDIQLQLFKRSFTTKGVGRGIGTYSMKLLGEKYLKGNVGFESSQENGTTFYIEL